MGYILRDQITITRPIVFLCGPYFDKNNVGDRRYILRKFFSEMNITLRQSRLSGVARATFPDKQSHLVINYCIMF